MSGRRLRSRSGERMTCRLTTVVGLPLQPTVTGPAAAEDFGRQWEAAEKFGRDKEIAQGVQIATLSDADLAEMKQRMAPHVESAIAALEKDGKPARKFYEEYTK